MYPCLYHKNTAAKALLDWIIILYVRIIFER